MSFLSKILISLLLLLVTGAVIYNRLQDVGELNRKAFALREKLWLSSLLGRLPPVAEPSLLLSGKEEEVCLLREEQALVRVLQVILVLVLFGLTFTSVGVWAWMRRATAQPGRQETNPGPGPEDDSTKAPPSALESTGSKAPAPMPEEDSRESEPNDLGLQERVEEASASESSLALPRPPHFLALQKHLDCIAVVESYKRRASVCRNREGSVPERASEANDLGLQKRVEESSASGSVQNYLDCKAIVESYKRKVNPFIAEKMTDLYRNRELTKRESDTPYPYGNVKKESSRPCPDSLKSTQLFYGRDACECCKECNCRCRLRCATCKISRLGNPFGIRCECNCHVQKKKKSHRVPSPVIPKRTPRPAPSSPVVVTKKTDCNCCQKCACRCRLRCDTCYSLIRDGHPFGVRCKCKCHDLRRPLRDSE